MKTVFVDTSGFYACLDGTDGFHPQALAAFERAEAERWELVTTNYVVHETWALVQRRQTRERRFSLTDTASLECMNKRAITQAIAQDEPFVRVRISLP